MRKYRLGLKNYLKLFLLPDSPQAMGWCQQEADRPRVGRQRVECDSGSVCFEIVVDRSMARTLYTMGYGGWPTKKRMAGMLDAFEHHGVTTLVDIRQSPCASDPTPNTNYSANEWNLQAAGGIEAQLNNRGMEYRWLIELGNPQKRDRTMKIMRAHLESGDERWPVNRGMRMLAEMIENSDHTFCLLCACAEYEMCHRKLVAEWLNDRHLERTLDIKDLGKSKKVP